MAARRTYRQPPIKEAVCQVSYAGASKWGLLAVSSMYEALQESYAVEPQQQLQAGLTLTEGDGQPGEHSITMQQQRPSYRFSNETNPERFVLVNSDYVSIHCGSPYEGWESFRQRIDAATHEFDASAKPEGISRIGVRYINSVTLPTDHVNIGDYFTFGIGYPDSLGLGMSGFIMRIEGVRDSDPMKVLTTFASVADEDPRSSTFLLDIDVVQQWPDSELLQPHRALEFIDLLRAREREVFEGLITDTLRGLFDAS